MRHGTDYGKTAGNRCSCDCHVRSGAESPQDPVRHFAFAYISTGYFSAQGKMDHCSVNINIILYLLDMPTPGQWRLLSCETTLDVVAMTLHACAVLIAPQGYWDLFPPVRRFLWLCTHRTSAPAYMIVRRNAAEIGSVWDLPAFAGIAGIGGENCFG